MSRNNLRALALIGAAAFLLRFGLAVVTETHPLFPAYYYTDSRLMDEASLDAMGRLARGEGYADGGTLGQRTQILVQTSVYRILGVHPFAMKLFNSILGALAVGALAAAAASAFGPAPALAAAAFCALWPSNVFYSSQNFKEAPTTLLAFLALAAFLPLLDERSSRRFWGALAAAGALCLLVAGFYRSYVMLTLSAALAASFLGACAVRRAAPRPLAFGLIVALGVPLAFLPVSRFATARAPGKTAASDPDALPQLIPTTYDAATERTFTPTSPHALSEFRRIRQESDRLKAQTLTGREIGTQILPDARFETWSDVIGFLPKGAFYVLFMPLPGLYPMAGKLGRLAAALENAALLILAGLAAVGVSRGPRTPARAAFLLFFLAMTAGSALLEFDLGSAGRHKLLYLPMLFPFAAEEILRLLGRKEPA